MNSRWLVRTAILLGLSVPSPAPERWRLIPASDSIVTGNLERCWRFPWFNGWHLWSRIRVQRVLKGDIAPGALISHTFLCSCCDSASFWSLHPDYWKTSIWYLKKTPAGDWSPPGGCDEFGQRPLSDLPELLEVRRKFTDEGQPR